MKISHANRFLTAALLANLTMATSMGCQLYSDGPDGAGSPSGRDLTGDDDDTSCVTKEGMNGGVCTTCIDAAGVETIMCAPADCYNQILPDGAICTTCADEAGHSQTVCEAPTDDPAPPDSECTTPWVESWRFICSYCNGDDGFQCEAAQCSTQGAGCYTCVDTKGNTVSECRENLGGASYTDTATGTYSFTSCTTTTYPDGTATKHCNFPGPDTCESYTAGDARCVECNYPDGSGGGTCLFDPSEPLPDPLFDRPSDLPARGECVTEESPGGFWSCTTCTAEDSSTTSSCSYTVPSSCAMEVLADGRLCSNCTYPDGSAVSLCFQLGF